MLRAVDYTETCSCESILWSRVSNYGIEAEHVRNRNRNVKKQKFQCQFLLCTGLSQSFEEGCFIVRVGGLICHLNQYNGSAMCVILLPDHTFPTFFSNTLGKFDGAMIPILAFMRLAKIRTMAQLNSPAMLLKRTKEV